MVGWLVGWFAAVDRYRLEDSESEKKFGFTFADSRRRALAGKPFLTGMKVYRTPAVVPAEKETGLIIRAAGGTVRRYTAPSHLGVCAAII